MSKLLTVRTDESGSIVLCGDVSLILNNRRAFRILRDNSIYVIEDGCIIFDENSDFNKTLDRIRNLARIVGCELEYSDRVNETVEDYIQEENTRIS